MFIEAKEIFTERPYRLEFLEETTTRKKLELSNHNTLHCEITARSQFAAVFIGPGCAAMQFPFGGPQSPSNAIPFAGLQSRYQNDRPGARRNAHEDRSDDVQILIDNFSVQLPRRDR